MEKVFEVAFKEAAAKATDEIAVAETLRLDEFATSYKNGVIRSDRVAFAQAFQKFPLGPGATWDEALDDRRQAIR